MAQRAGEKSWEAAISRRRWWNLFLNPGFHQRILERFNVQPGIFMTALSIGALVATAASLSVPMAGAWWVQQRNGNSGDVRAHDELVRTGDRRGRVNEARPVWLRRWHRARRQPLSVEDGRLVRH
jgi:hypothetical protein